MLSRTPKRYSRYIPVVGRAFVTEMLYGSKYSPNIGTYNMPYAYIKTMLMCIAGSRLGQRQREYICGIIECLMPATASEDNLTKLELLQFVEAMVPQRSSRTSFSKRATLTTAAGAGAGGASDVAEPALPVASTTCDSVAMSMMMQDTLHRHGTSDTSSGTLFGSIQHSGAGTSRSSEEDEQQQQQQQQCMEDEDDYLGQGESSVSRRVFIGGGGGGDLPSLISTASFPSSIARILIYDTVSACVAGDVYSAKEKARVAAVASQVGLSSAVREQIERLVLQERLLSNRKRKLLGLATFSVSSPAAEKRLLSSSSPSGAAASLVSPADVGSAFSSAYGAASRGAGGFMQGALGKSSGTQSLTEAAIASAASVLAYVSGTSIGSNATGGGPVGAKGDGRHSSHARYYTPQQPASNKSTNFAGTTIESSLQREEAEKLSATHRPLSAEEVKMAEMKARLRAFRASPAVAAAPQE